MAKICYNISSFIIKNLIAKIGRKGNKMKTRRRVVKINKRKAAEELFYVLITVIGVILFICNWTKTVPENNMLIAFVIAYGFLLGPFFMLIGTTAFLEAIEVL